MFSRLNEIMRNLRGVVDKRRFHSIVTGLVLVAGELSARRGVGQSLIKPKGPMRDHRVGRDTRPSSRTAPPLMPLTTAPPPDAVDHRATAVCR